MQNSNKKDNILILTQRVDINDDVLGFMHGWIAEFAKRCEKVTVICLKLGEFNFPSNVKVLSLGKEGGESKIKYLVNFYKYIWQERKNYDIVFAHMNYEYILLGGIIWRLLGKKIGLWYAHGKVRFELKIAEILADEVFTSTTSGFRLPSKKLHVVGQGIDTDKFQLSNQYKNPDLFSLITVGRISPVKGYDVVLSAINIIKNKIGNFKLTIIGAPVMTEHVEYLGRLKNKVRELNLTNQVEFIGALPNDKIIPYLQQADLMINASSTGSLDKVMPEAMATGLPIVTCNVAIKAVIKEDWQRYFFTAGDIDQLAEKILFYYDLKQSNQISELAKKLREIVIKDHDLKNLVTKILDLYI
ncbi:glycosyltransferase family 4 protein [Candidatus Parcubacteria bacterium]|nr:glycosyltransferase family 4 protein [Patescibacteria group bacterium]MCG2686993.1 glycosyltransferase family 4 protein [Candidatus Parcubacteria bacterium]